MKVLIFGTFDHLHPGHEFVIREAMKRGKVTVVIARDANVQKIKGHAPGQSEAVRMKVIASRFSEVIPILGDPEDFLMPVRTVQPDLILLGYDQKLPPRVAEKDLPCPVERLPAHRPEEFKSSKRRGKTP